MLPAVHETGTGDTVLFLHAYTLDASQWDHQVAALSGDVRCVRVDLWGCGDSPAPPAETPALDSYAASVLAVLDARGIDRFTVVGISMGGYLAFALLRLAPSRIRALVLSAPARPPMTRRGAMIASPLPTVWSASSRSSPSSNR